MAAPTNAQEAVLVRSHEVQFLLENPILQDAFRALEAKYILGWRNSKGSTSEEREKLYWLITALDEVRGELTRQISAGKIVSEELRQEAVSLRGDNLNGNGDWPGVV